MYDCDKGYILSEKGPVGATCVAGLWRPIEMPKCTFGQHPRLRYNRRKRDAELRRNYLLLRNYRMFKRKLSEMIHKQRYIDDPFPLKQNRIKRSVVYHQNHRRIQKRPNNVNHKWKSLAPAISRFKRSFILPDYTHIDYQLALLNDNFRRPQRNRYEEQQRAYSKYFEKIKQKHRNYISNLLRASHSPINRAHDVDLVRNNNDENIYQKDDEYMQPAKDPFDEINAYASMPIPLPNINQNMNMYSKKEVHDGIVNNTFVGRNREKILHDKNKNRTPSQLSNDFLNFVPEQQNEKNLTNILELLRSQIIRRRKRSTDTVVEVKRNKLAKQSAIDDETILQNDEETREGDAGTKKVRTKEPCEVRAEKFF